MSASITLKIRQSAVAATDAALAVAVVVIGLFGAIICKSPQVHGK
jgi:hypothetical protein